VRRGPVTVVAGRGGIGKTALVLHVLRAAFARRAETALHVRLAPALAPGQAGLEIARALVEPDKHGRVDWSGALRDPHDALAIALDLAEAGERWVVLDDLHHAGPDEQRTVLELLSRYAVRSRWIVTTRIDPALVALAGQALALTDMERRELAKLARAIAPGATARSLAPAIEDARGSPWKLLQRIGPGARPDAGDVLATLAPAAREIVSLLALVSSPLPERILGAVAQSEPVDAAVMDLLERRGVVERTADGVRLHDALRPVACEGLPAPATARARMIEALSNDALPECALEALRLLLADAQAERAASLLERRGDDLVTAGYARAIHHAVDASPIAARLEHWRLRCAVETGDLAVLGALGEPVDRAPRTRLLWSRVLHAQGRVLDAASVALDALALAQASDGATTPGGAELAFEAGMQAARAIVESGAIDRALELAESLAPPSDAHAARRDMMVARCLTTLDRHADALALVARVREKLPGMDAVDADRVAYGIAAALYQLGRLRDAAEALEQAMLGASSRSFLVFRGRDALFLRACIAMDIGHIDEAESILMRLEPFVGRASLLRPYVDVARVDTRLATGDLDGLERTLAEIVAGGRDSLDSELRAWAASHALRLALLTARPPPEDALELPAPSTRTVAHSLLELRRRRWLLRAGRASSANAAASPLFEHLELRLAARSLRADAALLRSDHTDAAAEADALVVEAREERFALGAIEGMALRCDVALAAGAREDLAAAARELAAAADELGSRRFELEARLFATIASGSVTIAMLEDLAAHPDVAPVAARRARALLGVDAPLDAVDHFVLARARSLASVPHAEHVAPVTDGFDAGRAWGIDEARSHVWLPGGREVDLSDRPLLMRLLGALAARRGTASKEELVVDVWRVAEYHPLKHDNRLQVAVRKLRQAIEDEPSRPTRLVTTATGYALGGNVRRVVSAS